MTREKIIFNIKRIFEGNLRDSTSKNIGKFYEKIYKEIFFCLVRWVRRARLLWIIQQDKSPL